ncbi:hypothetical protein SCALM49S_02593 [Streptomyces californicus]
MSGPVRVPGCLRARVYGPRPGVGMAVCPGARMPGRRRVRMPGCPGVRRARPSPMSLRGRRSHQEEDVRPPRHQAYGSGTEEREERHAHPGDHPEHHRRRLDRDDHGLVRPSRPGGRGHERRPGGEPPAGRPGRRAAPGAADVRGLPRLLAGADRGPHGHHRLPRPRGQVRRLQHPHRSRMAELDGADRRSRRSDPAPQGRGGPGHRSDRQHHPGPHRDRGGAGRRVPPLRLSHRPGPGPGLFPEGYEVPRLRLLESRAFRSGITLQRYAPA